MKPVDSSSRPGARNVFLYIPQQMVVWREQTFGEDYVDAYTKRMHFTRRARIIMTVFLILFFISAAAKVIWKF